MLESDLQLKKDTAKFTSPEIPEGKEYWDKLYKKAEEIFGANNITIPTLTRPWIVPDEIIISETTGSAYIYKATLKVMLEQDYLKDSVVYNFEDDRLKELNEYSSQLIREIVIPKLTKEVNSSKRYASLRQVYYSLIMAQWFKTRFQGEQGKYYRLINSQNLQNLNSKEPWSKTFYFKEYQKSFQDGEYNIREPVYTPTGQVIRSYFSGGMQIMPKMFPQGMGQEIFDNETGAHINMVPRANSFIKPDKVMGVEVKVTDTIGELGEIRESGADTNIKEKETQSSSPAFDHNTGWKDPSLFDKYSAFRRDVRPAFKRIVEQVFGEYLNKATKILEIGSGQGELSSLLPPDVRSRIIQSDRTLDHLQRNPSKTSKLVFDAYKIPFRDQSITEVVSYTVLDTFADLDTAFKEIYRILENDGIMVAFLDLSPSHETSMVYSPDIVLFPAVMNMPNRNVRSLRGFLQVNKNILLQQIEKNGSRLPLPWMNILQRYISDPITEFGILCHYEKASQIAEIFKQILSILEVPYIEVDQLDLFKQRLLNALEGNGFQIIESETKTAVVEVEKDFLPELPPNQNIIVFHTGSKWYGFDGDVPKGKVRIMGSIYTVVAKKSSSRLNLKKLLRIP